MQSVIISIFGALLFFLLSPGIVMRSPVNGSRFVVAGAHAVVFAVIFYLLNGPVFTFFRNLEGITVKDPKNVQGTQRPNSSSEHKK